MDSDVACQVCRRYTLFFWPHGVTIPTVKHDKRDCPLVLEGYGTASVRKSVALLAASVWRYRRDLDHYTLVSRSGMLQYEVDHCFEVQLVQYALMIAGTHVLRGNFTAKNLTSVTEKFVARVINSPVNLNVTDPKTNSEKKTPIVNWLAERVANQPSGYRYHDIDWFAKARSHWQANWSVWVRIKLCMLAAVNGIVEQLRPMALLPEEVEALDDVCDAMLEIASLMRLKFD